MHAGKLGKKHGISAWWFPPPGGGGGGIFYIIHFYVGRLI